MSAPLAPGDSRPVLRSGRLALRELQMTRQMSLLARPQLRGVGLVLRELQVTACMVQRVSDPS